MGFIVPLVLILVVLVIVFAVASKRGRLKLPPVDDTTPPAIDPAPRVSPGGRPSGSRKAHGHSRSARVTARGLVLSASQQSTASKSGGRRFERRQMTIEIEIPGESPYVASGYFLAPRGLVEAIPGASLELEIDRSNPSFPVILGPGGFTGPWLRTGPPRAF